MNQFVYNISTKVYFGENQLGHLGEELKKFGTRVLRNPDYMTKL